MNKRILFLSILSIILMALLCASAAYPNNFANAIDTAQPIQVVPITDGDVLGTASLYGSGENYITDIKITVRFDDYAPYDISLKDGYSPLIAIFDFGAADKLLFCSSQTGGSGGYGNYQVYKLQTDSYQLLYDDKIDSANTSFSASFQPEGFMQLINNSTRYTLPVYVGYMDSSFYDMIFAPDGSVKGESPYVNDISFVSPALNPANGLWRLVTYRSVVAVAEVNRLGYIVQTLDFDGESFIPMFTEFALRL